MAIVPCCNLFFSFSFYFFPDYRQLKATVVVNWDVLCMASSLSCIISASIPRSSSNDFSWNHL